MATRQRQWTTSRLLQIGLCTHACAIQHVGLMREAGGLHAGSGQADIARISVQPFACTHMTQRQQRYGS